jgi:excisionase family DNA binding protein
MSTSQIASPSAQGGDVPLVVPPLEAARQLGIGLSTTYKLIKTGELDAFRCGRRRRITVASIHAYIARRIAADSAGWTPIMQPPPALLRSRRRWPSKSVKRKGTAPPKRRARTDQHELLAE